MVEGTSQASISNQKPAGEGLQQAKPQSFQSSNLQAPQQLPLKSSLMSVGSSQQANGSSGQTSIQQYPPSGFSPTSIVSSQDALQYVLSFFFL